MERRVDIQRDVSHILCLKSDAEQVPAQENPAPTELRSPYLGVYPDIGNLKNAAVIYGTDVVEDLKKGRGHIFAAHLKETSPGVYRDMSFGQGGHTEYVPCIRELLDQGVRMFTGEFWYHGEENYREKLAQASDFLRTKIKEAAEGRS